MNAAKYIRYILTIATALLFFSAYTYLLVGSLAFATREKEGRPKRV